MYRWVNQLRRSALPLCVLGIETSCDETAAAVVTGDRSILSNVVLSQLDDHAAYGGVVPEVAARAHLAHLRGVVQRAMAEAGVHWSDLDGVAATSGPGLIGGLIVGVMTAKGIAAARELPFLAINHLEAHALTARLTDDLQFPYLLLLVSGGHSQLLVVEGVGRYHRLGTTIDDAIGEAFDKVAKVLGLAYPGGPEIERCAETGNGRRFSLPRPMVGRPGCDLSMSGLKAAVKRLVDSLPPGPLPQTDVADIAAAFQSAVGDSVVDRTRNAAALFLDNHPNGGALVVAGGVAANQALRRRLSEVASNTGLTFIAPPLPLCGDNGAMVAWAGIERLRLGLVDDLDFAPRPRWPLDPHATPARGAGIKA